MERGILAMRMNTQDETLKRNYLQKYRFLIGEYEQVKAKSHPKFRFAKEFYAYHDTDPRSFLKYYHRWRQSGQEEDLLPQRRGPKWKTRRPDAAIETDVLALREQGLNRYEITHVLRPKLGEATPSPSGVYNICRRQHVNRLRPPMKANRCRIIKTKAGELGHIDTHCLSKCLIAGESRHRYFVCVVDSCTRVAWAEVVDDITALTVMFAALRCLNILSDRFQIRFKEVLTDNGPEVGIKSSTKKAGHPFERMLMELGITHRYTRPYRPQTNGKAERFWRTLEEDLLYETTFASVEELKKELFQYLLYYNHHRPHQALDGQTPAAVNEKCPRIT
jgi:transposase InsO family protein